MKKYNPFILPVIRSLLFMVSSLFLIYMVNISQEATIRWWSAICIVVNVITIIILILITRNEGQSFFSLLNYKKGQVYSRYTLWVVLAMLLLGVGGMYGFGFLIYGRIPTLMIQPLPITFAIVNLILLPITIVFSEFPLYFGYSLNRIDKMTKNKWLAIAYPMFFYALQHSFLPLIFEWKFILFRFLSFLPLLFVLGILYYKNRKLLPLMIGHGVLDFMTAIQILIVSLYPSIYDILSNV